MTKENFLKDCIEYQVRKKELYFCLFVLCFILLLFSPLIFLNLEIAITLIILSILCTIPFVLYFIIKIHNLKKYFDDYVYFEVVLDKINSSYRGRVYFTVTFIYSNTKYICDTREIFSTRAIDFIYFPLENYANKKVIVAFNPKLDEVVLVKKV